MVEGFGGVITKLTEAQAKYIHVKVEGPASQSPTVLIRIRLVHALM